MQSVSVAFGGPSQEHDISILTGLQAERLLLRAGLGVRPLYWDQAGQWHLVENETEARDYLQGAPHGSTPLEVRLGVQGGFVKRQRIGSRALDVGTVLNCMHGGLGEGGGAQALFELLGVPATGGSMHSASLCMDKLAFSALAHAAGIPILPRRPVERSLDGPDLPGPYIVKPRFGGSSIGIEVVDSYDAAVALASSSVHFRAGAVVEPYRSDLYDLNVAFRTYPQLRLSAIEKPLRASDGDKIYSFKEKYLHAAGLSSAPRELPASAPSTIVSKINDYSVLLASYLGITGIVRVDFLSNGEELYVNEVNSIPGALALYLWVDDDPTQIILDALAEAENASSYHSVSVDNAHEALRVAGGIAGKLSGLPNSRGG